MDALDFAKYNEAQLRQILTRIDRERFPGRVEEIKARLWILTHADPDAAAQISLDPSTFVVKPMPDAKRKVFGLALPFYVAGTISFGIAVIANFNANPSVLRISLLVGMVAVFAALALTFYRLCTLACSECGHECERRILDNRNWGATCKRCQINWDTGIGSDD